MDYLNSTYYRVTVILIRFGNMKTLVLGASTHDWRYSNKAIKLLRAHKHEVVAIGREDGEVSGVKIEQQLPAVHDIDTVTLYVNPQHQKEYYNSIIELKPRRIIFNPGTENTEFVQLATQSGIETEYACTLVLLNTGQY